MNLPTSLLTYPRRHRAGLRGRLLAALGLLAWLAPPLTADVIDDFNGPPKWNVIFDLTGVLDYEFVDGQLKMSRPSQAAGYNRVMWYWRTYAVPEDRWLELRLDHVTASAYRIGSFIGFGGFPLSGQVAYIVWYLPGQISLTKIWFDELRQDKAALFILNANVPRIEEPITVVFGLRREGSSMNLLAKLVMRDDPNAVIFEETFTDHSGPDEVIPYPDPAFVPDLVPPLLGPSLLVSTGMLDADGPRALREQVIDHFVCSEDPVPVALGIRRESDTQVVLTWPGAYVPFAAASPQGPWEPCPELIADGESGSRMALALSGSSKFFRLVRGWNAAMFFEAANARPNWVAKPMGAGSAVPSYTYPGGHLRVMRTAGGIRDFAFYDGNAFSWWPKDCVGSVDILGWDAALEGQRFGLLLRVKPDQEVWYINQGVPEQRYSGLLTFTRTENPAESELAILGPGGAPLEATRFAALDPTKQYRLRFSAVGDQLKLQLFDLAQPEVVIQSCAAADGSVSAGMVAFQGTMSADGKYDVTIDGFILNGSTR